MSCATLKLVHEESSSLSSESATVTWKDEQLYGVRIVLLKLSVRWSSYLLKVNLEYLCLKCAEKWHFDLSYAIAEWEKASVYTLKQTYDIE